VKISDIVNEQALPLPVDPTPPKQQIKPVADLVKTLGAKAANDPRYVETIRKFWALSKMSGILAGLEFLLYSPSLNDNETAEIERIKALDSLQTNPSVDRADYEDLADAFGPVVEPITQPEPEELPKPERRTITQPEPQPIEIPSPKPITQPEPEVLPQPVIPQPVIPQPDPGPEVQPAPSAPPTRTPSQPQRRTTPNPRPQPNTQSNLDPAEPPTPVIPQGKKIVPVPLPKPEPKPKPEPNNPGRITPVIVPPAGTDNELNDLYAYLDARGSYYDWDKPGVPLKENTNTASLSENELETMIRNSAEQRGMDPDVAVRVWRSEGGTSYQSNVPRGGKGSEDGREASYGPFQLYTGGGLGNEYEEKYGVDLRDDNTPEGIQRQIDFALNKAVEKGWGPWKGAARVNIGPRDGLEQSFIPEPETISPDTRKLDPQQMATDVKQGFDTISQTAQDYAKKGYDYVAPIAKDLGKKTSDYLNKKWQNFKTDAMATDSGTDTAAIAGAGDTGELPNVTRPRSPGAPPEIKGGPIVDKAKALGTAALDKASELNKSTKIVDKLKQKYIDFTGQNKITEPVKEKAPPGDKYERMVKDIKKGYAKDGKLTDTERGIAYATAWKLYNKRKGKKS